VEIPYNEIFNFMDTFIDDYILPKFQIRLKKLVRQHKNNIIITINTNIKENFNKLPNTIERHNDNISDILQRFFKYSENPLAYDI
jgi:hypothetical protein